MTPLLNYVCYRLRLSRYTDKYNTHLNCMIINFLTGLVILWVEFGNRAINRATDRKVQTAESRVFCVSKSGKPPVRVTVTNSLKEVKRTILPAATLISNRLRDAFPEI